MNRGRQTQMYERGMPAIEVTSNDGVDVVTSTGTGTTDRDVV